MRRLVVLVLAGWVGLALLGPWLAPGSDRVDLDRVLAAPGEGAWLGSDDLGRPVWDRLVSGARVSLLVAVPAVTLSLAIGAPLGAFSAWRGGAWDHLTTRVVDVFLAFPGLLLAIALAGTLGPGIGNVVAALAAVGWVAFARLARAQTLSVRTRDHVQAALALGVSETRIVFRHLLPLVAGPLAVEATFALAGAVIAEASLSFLGLGVQPPAASWGSMIRDGTRYLLVAPHLVLAPGIALALVVLAVNLLGDQLRDRVDVRSLPPRRDGAKAPPTRGVP
ncbi:MAG: ABC transporter permease [Gammaproteobacteria bacterium]|nr:ABC transporter permease [Gammaproteobacteria bacterium]